MLQIILDLLRKDGPPDSKAIQTLINKLKVSTLSGVGVQKTILLESFICNFFFLMRGLNLSLSVSSAAEGCRSGEIANKFHGTGPESA